MNYRHLTALMTCCLLMLACGNTDAGNKTLNNIDEGIAKKGETVKGKLTAADMLTPQAIATSLGLDQNAIHQSSLSGNFVSYEWEKPNKEEIEAQNQKNMMDSIRARANGENPGIPTMIKSENVIGLYLNSFTDEAAAAAAYKAHLARMKEGVTAKTEQAQATFVIDYETPIEGVGQQAAWSTKRKQLAVQFGQYMVFLDVDMHQDVNVANAKKLMTQIITNL